MFKKIIFLLFLCLSVFSNNIDDFENEFISNDKVEVDRFYKYNTFMTDFNYAIYNMSIRPVTNIYNVITPPLVKKGVDNFFHNLSSPLRFISLFLSGEFKTGAAEFGSFLGNTILGFGGILKPYKYEKNSDFGLMLARWGVSSGEHVVLPFFGPSNIRDASMLPFNLLLNPSFYVNKDISVGLTGLNIINDSSKKMLLIDEAYKSVKPYIVIRDFYEKSREENK